MSKNHKNERADRKDLNRKFSDEEVAKYWDEHSFMELDWSNAFTIKKGFTNLEGTQSNKFKPIFRAEDL